MLCRLALENEWDVFTELARLASAESEPEAVFSREATHKTFELYLERANPTIFFVEEKRDVFGFLLATMSKFRHRAGFYTTQEVLYVRPDKRGSRAAAILMKNFCSWSDRLGAQESTGGVDNGFQIDRTERFLEHFGFSRVGVLMKRQGQAHG